MKKDDITIGFAFHGIKTEQFAIFEENYAPKKETTLAAELQFKLDQKNKQIGVFLEILFMQGKKIFLKIQVSCHVNIEEKSWHNFAQEENTQLVVPKNFLTHLAIIATGTTRGILFAKTESTPFSKFILPTLNVAEMITEDAVFELVVD